MQMGGTWLLGRARCRHRDRQEEPRPGAQRHHGPLHASSRHPALHAKRKEPADPRGLPAGSPEPPSTPGLGAGALTQEELSPALALTPGRPWECDQCFWFTPLVYKRQDRRFP